MHRYQERIVLLYLLNGAGMTMARCASGRCPTPSLLLRLLLLLPTRRRRRSGALATSLFHKRFAMFWYTVLTCTQYSSHLVSIVLLNKACLPTSSPAMV